MVREWNDGTLYLAHHGIKGQKWGVRRFQNPDGTLTEEGKLRLDKYKSKELNTASTGYAKKLSGIDKKITRLQNKEKKNIYKGKNTEKISLKLKGAKAHYKDVESLMNKELKAIKSMSYSDMMNEKKKIASEGRKAVAASVLTTVAFGLLGSPVSAIYYPNTAEIKRKIRIGE